MSGGTHFGGGDPLFFTSDPKSQGSPHGGYDDDLWNLSESPFAISESAVLEHSGSEIFSFEHNDEC